MIAYVSGNIIAKREGFLILDVQGVGYKVFVSGRTLDKIAENQQGVKLFCHLHVRENTMDLYGFLTLEELELFEMIDNISGIGPKASLQVAALGSSAELKKAIEAKDEKFFSGVHGIGKKKIQKIILELTGKFEELNSLGRERQEDREVINALVNLGFSQAQAKHAVSQVPQSAKTLEQRIRAAFKVMRD